MSKTILRLLMPVTKSVLTNRKTIELGGKFWTLVDFKQSSKIPPYTCISYSWGKTKTDNPLDGKQKISNRTIPVIETVINSFNFPEQQYAAMKSLFNKDRLSEKIALAHKASHAIWIDALCCPQQKPNFDMCIKNMGKIYKESTQVYTVLNATCFDVIHKIHNKEELNINDYLSVINDDWIDRAWTYQEAMNSKMMFFLSEGKEEVLINERYFLNALTTYEKNVYANIKDINLYQKLERMQFLFVALELEGQSVFQVMTAMSKRSATSHEERINAMISVIENTNTYIQDRYSITPAEHFMKVCEKNNDYSFIFSINSRNKVPGKRWRPLGDQIIPVISHVSVSGSGLRGYFKDTYLELHNMYRMIPWKSNLTINIIEDFMKDDFPNSLLEQLRQRGFTGCGECLKLENGYFFPQSSHKRSKNLFVAISHDVKFYIKSSSGAPGLLLYSSDNDINQFCDVGVFIGKFPTIKETINIS